VALALSMWSIYDVRAGQVMFSTSDVGWAVGHSYNVYGPLIAGATSVLYEGLPTHPDPGIWWRICEQYGVRTMFSSPTAIRVLKKQDPSWLTRHDLSTLRWLFLAGEPLDEPTAQWITDGIGKPIIDNYWQTETGWRFGADAQTGPETGEAGRRGCRPATVRDRRGNRCRCGPNQKGRAGAGAAAATRL
jgi:propionyl-CoA synthetase